MEYSGKASQPKRRYFSENWGYWDAGGSAVGHWEGTQRL